MIPVEDFAPKAKASKVTLKRDSPLRPDFDMPMRNAAKIAKLQPEKEVMVAENKIVKIMWL